MCERSRFRWQRDAESSYSDPVLKPLSYIVELMIKITMRKSRILAAAMLLALAGCTNNLGPMEPDELAGIPLTVRATVGDSGVSDNGDLIG